MSAQLDARKNLVTYLIKTEGKPTNTSWAILEEKYKIRPGKNPGQNARAYWKWYEEVGINRDRFYPSYLDKRENITEPTGELILKSRWQVQTKDGIEWLESYRNKTDLIVLEEYSNYIIQSFKNSVKDLSPINIKPVKVDNKRALFLYTSDKHIGAKTGKASMYENTYNPEVVKKRFERLKVAVQEEFELHGTFNKILVADLGDPVDGMGGKTTRGGHMLPQNLDDREQFDVYVQVHIEFFTWLIAGKYAKEYDFVCATNDNHAGAFGYIANRGVEIYLNARFPKVKTHLSSKFMFHFLYGQHAFIFTHGKDEEDLRNGMPLHLNEKVEAKVNDYIDYHKLYDYMTHLVKGDLHQSCTEYAKRFRYKNVMSFYGASKWIHTNFGPGESGVDYEIVYAKRNKIIENRLVF